jgi:hypothetical protein
MRRSTGASIVTISAVFIMGGARRIRRLIWIILASLRMHPRPKNGYHLIIQSTKLRKAADVEDSETWCGGLWVIDAEV